MHTDMYLSGLTPSKGVDLGRSKNIHKNDSTKELPQTFDWSTQNVIGPILDQEKVNHFVVLVLCCVLQINLNIVLYM